MEVSMMKLSHILIMTVVGFALVFAGCDSTGAGGGGGSGSDGSLTAAVSGVPMDLESTTEGDDDLLFAAFVFDAEGDPLNSTGWVAMVAEEIVGGNASGTAFQIVDGARGDEWAGTGGENYEVYYTVYRVTLPEEGPPQKAGEHFTKSNPEYIHGTIDWQTPITYQQDGDHSLTSSFANYLDTAYLELVAQGALGLIGSVMDNLPGDGPPDKEGMVTLEPPIDGITVEMTANNGDASTIDAELVITIADYVFTDTGLDPAPTATGNITLSISAPIVDGEPQEGDMEIGFATTDLTLSQGPDSVAVEMDGIGSDPGSEGFETFTGTFTVDGVEHDLSILTDMYNIP